MEQASAGLNDTRIATSLDCTPWTVRRVATKSTQAWPRRFGLPDGTSCHTFNRTQKDAYWCDQTLPSRANIGRLLKHAGLTRRDLTHHNLNQPPRTYLTSPHQEWQMDAQGIMQVERVGKVSLISIVDVTRRLKVESYPSLKTTDPALADHPLSDAPERFSRMVGLPEGLTLDQGTVFYESTTPSPLSHAIAYLATRTWHPSALYAASAVL